MRPWFQGDGRVIHADGRDRNRGTNGPVGLEPGEHGSDVNGVTARDLRQNGEPGDAAGLVPLDDWHVVQQIELVERPFEITEHRARKYLDQRTGRMVLAPLPPEVAAGGLVGSKLSALIAYQKSACHMSYATVQTFLKDVLGLSLSTGQLARVIQKASAALTGPYDELAGALAKQAYLGIDETGHPENGANLWTWCFRADGFAVFRIDPSRGSAVLKEVLGETFGGIIGCDYYSAYRAYLKDADATVQFCMAHLIREIRFLAEHGNRWTSAWTRKLLGWLKKLFATLHRADRLTAAGFARAMDRIRRGFLAIARRPPGYSEAQPLAKRFRPHPRYCPSRRERLLNTYVSLSPGTLLGEEPLFFAPIGSEMAGSVTAPIFTA